MQELFMMFAKIMPEEDLIKLLEEAICEYKADPSKDNKGKMAMYCALVAAQVGTADKELPEVLKELGQRKQLLDAFEHRNH
jgi:hypothetical protein